MAKTTSEGIGSFRLSRLLMLSERQYQRYLSDVLKRNDLGFSDYPILLILFHAKNEGTLSLSQTDIANHNIQDKALVTRAVKKLSQQGLVTLALDPANRSRHLVSLTEQGYAKALAIDEAIYQWEQGIWDAIGEEDLGQAQRLFQKLYREYLKRTEL